MDGDDFLRASDPLPEAMLLVDGEGEIVSANRAARRLLGEDPGALRGRPLAGIAADPPGEIARFLRECSRTRQLLPGLLTIPDASGGPARFRAEGAVYRPRTESEGPLVLLRLIPRDEAVSRFLALDEKIEQLSREIRSRLEAERELRQQREWFQVVLSSIGDAVIATDDRGRVLFMNAVAEALTGWPLAEAGGRPLGEVFHIVNEETRRPVGSPVDRVLREGVVVGLANHTILLGRDGTERAIDDSAAPIRGHDDRLRGVVLIFRDVAERRVIEQQLVERSRMLAEEARRKNEFLAMLSHELRNPLAPLRNALRVLRFPDRSGEEVAWATGIMERQVAHLSRLVDDLLDLSRVIHGKIELKTEPVGLDLIVTRAVDAARPLIDARGHELTLSLPGRPIRLRVDPTRLEQVLVNLLLNASKYTEPGGRIRLECRRSGDRAEIRVRDNGIGIDAGLLDSVFDLFTQADQSLARSQGGLGIGLTLVRTIVLLHGGTVEATSPGPGLGSEFVVRLPLEAEPDASTAPPAAGPATAPPEARRVLVVDDLVDSALTLGKLIGLMGHQVRIAHDGPSALEAARDYRPDFVLLDIGLPGMDGYEVARELQRRGDHDAGVLIALTGYGQQSDRENSLRAGFAHHLVKPVDLDRLQEILDHPPPPGRDPGPTLR
ncbi:hybrid sensor histidine kinase/response regulator [Tautonia plasticadhaerens]|uniref:histidine kinase n=1 Tax=Tautonia plasticadhaerens TaxID=2527974 RepID=A0A518H6U2_9BACT|nr:ATP-binding protein [Tautonia plasticadhaerens]QDV36599.1 Autoinducer 2 sensor kinase/phosphatase LuxQ [Tautonia plasticadhaerens]